MRVRLLVNVIGVNGHLAVRKVLSRNIFIQARKLQAWPIFNERVRCGKLCKKNGLGNSDCCARYITGCISKNLTLYKNAWQTKLTIGKWSSLLILQQQQSHDQNKVKNVNILK